MKTIVKVNNLPSYAWNYPEIVATLVNGEYWFYGAYSTEEEAERVAWEIGGEVVDIQ